MIVITIQTCDDYIISMNINGHAMYGKYNHDIVCAGVSAICFGLCNALDLLSENSVIEISDNNILIKIEKDDKSQLITKTAIIQLETMQEVYSKNIKIKKTGGIKHEV